MTTMTPKARTSIMSKVGHETLGNIFTFVYAFLATNMLLALANAPLVFFLAVVANPAASWPFFLALSVTVLPSLAGAFAVFAAIQGASGKDAQPFKTFFLAYGRGLRTSVPTSLVAVGIVGILLADVAFLGASKTGALLVPLLVVMAVLAVVTAVATIAGAVMLPQARLRDLVRAALFLAVKRWYLSLAAIVLLGLIAALTLVQPVMGIALAPAPLLFVVWSNASFAISAALAAPSASAT